MAAQGSSSFTSWASVNLRTGEGASLPVVGSGRTKLMLSVCVWGGGCPAGHGSKEVPMEAGEQGVLEAPGSGNIS